MLFRLASSKFTGKATKFEDVMFADMPKKAQAAAEALGFDEEKWNNQGWPRCEDKWWEDLSSKEQEAATELGWDIDSWDEKYENKVRVRCVFLASDLHSWPLPNACILSNCITVV